MARIRTVKPDLFRHEGLLDLEVGNPGFHVMLVFVALFGHCDKEGRFRWKPRSLKLDILPFLDYDLSASLMLLREANFVHQYSVDGKEYGIIPTFKEHQRINGKEAKDPPRYPAPSEVVETKHENEGEEPGNKQCNAGEATGKHQGQQEGKGREEEGKKDCADAPFEDSNIQFSHPEPNKQEPTKADAERELFARGKDILGQNAGGQIVKLLKAKEGSVAQARAALEIASEKENPREYIGAVLRNGGEEDVQAWTDELHREWNVH